MSNFYTLIKKELKELINKQMIFSLVFMVVMFGMMGRFIGGMVYMALFAAVLMYIIVAYSTLIRY